MGETKARDATIEPRPRHLGADGDLRRVTKAARLTTISEFATVVIHDINQPLSAVITNAHAALRWLDRPTPDLAEVRIALEHISRDADRTRQVIADARAWSGRTLPSKERVSINRLVCETLVLAGAGDDPDSVRLETALDDALPDVLADPAHLQQVALNLVLNALESMDAAPGRPHVLGIVSCFRGADEIAVSISDTGVGLGVDGPLTVFKPFFTTKAGGLGLGLSICRSIVESCGGRLTALPNHPNGAVFTFTLPALGSAP